MTSDPNWPADSLARRLPSDPTRRCLYMRVWLAVLVTLFLAAPVRADEGQSQPNATPDFLFGRPRGSIGIRGGWTIGRAASDWYHFVTDQLTLTNRDFNRPAIGTEGTVTLTRRLDLVFGV